MLRPFAITVEIQVLQVKVLTVESNKPLHTQVHDALQAGFSHFGIPREHVLQPTAELIADQVVRGLADTNQLIESVRTQVNSRSRHGIFLCGTYPTINWGGIDIYEASTHVSK